MKGTAVHDEHIRLGGKMVEFAGYEMPMQYQGIVKEHAAVRERAGLFDVSHMGAILVTGEKAKELLMKVLTNNVEQAKDFECVYTHITDENGKIIDDMILTKFSEDSYFCVPNASMTQVIFDWFSKNNVGADIENVSGQYLVAPIFFESFRPQRTERGTSSMVRPEGSSRDWRTSKAQTQSPQSF